MQEQLKTKTDLLGKLKAYRETTDDYVTWFKCKIREKLLLCPELLYALNRKDLEQELFDEQGNIKAKFNDKGEILGPEGEWDLYYRQGAIREYIPYIENVPDNTRNFLFYDVSFDDSPQNNSAKCYMNITFTALCGTEQNQIMEASTGIPRQDLIVSIIREKFNWSNIFGTRCRMIRNEPTEKNANFLTRTIVFQCTLLNSIVNTPYKGQTQVINNQVRR